MQKSRVFLSSPHMSGNEQKYIQEAFDLNSVSTFGNNVDVFEKELSTYNLINDTAAVTSRTAAIHLALRLLGADKGDTIFCSTLTSVASANPILYQGATPIFIDSEPDTWGMSPFALLRAFQDAVENGKLPKAVIVVNLYGQSARMDELVEICESYGVPIIEDAAESLGSDYKGKKSGTFGHFGIFSFKGDKMITTSGGGALISNDVEALKKARFLATRACGPAIYDQHSNIGYDYQMSNIVAGIGRAQLEVLDDRVAARRAVFEQYYEAFGDVAGIEFQPELEGTKSSRWLTAMTVDPDVTGIARNDMMEALGQEDIETRPVWKPMHMQPLFRGAAYYAHAEGNSVADRLFANGICLPSGSNLTIADQDRVIDGIRTLLGKKVVVSSGVE